MLCFGHIQTTEILSLPLRDSLMGRKDLFIVGEKLHALVWTL